MVRILDFHSSNPDSNSGRRTKEKKRLCHVLAKERVAIPDFYLPRTNEIVEIKSTWTYNKQEMNDKFEAYRNLGYIPKLILDRKEVLGL